MTGFSSKVKVKVEVAHCRYSHMRTAIQHVGTGLT